MTRRGTPPAYIVGSFDLFALVERARAAAPGDVVLSTRLNMMVRDGRLIELPPTKFRLVLALAGPAALSVKESIETMWGDDAAGGPENAPRTLYVHMCQLRPWLARLGLRIVRPLAGYYAIEADRITLTEAAE
ncbi:helix-turn-helix domain-containing protein [Methylocella sp.]|uniref:helix-turn-helix domain-containing protein n=1 Tax=Methylocella sp. TaxID=1978226 RepID=UPI0035AF529F